MAPQGGHCSIITRPAGAQCMAMALIHKEPQPFLLFIDLVCPSEKIRFYDRSFYDALTVSLASFFKLYPSVAFLFFSARIFSYTRSFSCFTFFTRTSSLHFRPLTGWIVSLYVSPTALTAASAKNVFIAQVNTGWFQKLLRYFLSRICLLTIILSPYAYVILHGVFLTKERWRVFGLQSLSI